MNYRDWCESMNCVYTPLSLTEAAWDAATRESFKVIMKVSARANTLAERVKELEAKQAADEGSVRVPVQLLRDMQSNAAIGEPEWSTIEEQLQRFAAAKGQ